MKTIIALAAFALLSTGAMAKDYPCVKLAANWIGAPEFHCDRADGRNGGFASTPGVPAKECEDTK